LGQSRIGSFLKKKTFTAERRDFLWEKTTTSRTNLACAYFGIESSLRGLYLITNRYQHLKNLSCKLGGELEQEKRMEWAQTRGLTW